MNKKNAMLFQTLFGEYPTFSMLPLDDTTPFSEVIWDRANHRLAVVSKNKRQTFQMIPMLDTNGYAKVAKNGRDMRERKLVELSIEFYLAVPEEIDYFINTFASNVDEFDYKRYMIVPEAPKVETDPEPPKEDNPTSEEANQVDSE